MADIILKYFSKQSDVKLKDIALVIKSVPSKHLKGITTIAYDPSRYFQRSYSNPSPINYRARGEYQRFPFDHILVYKFESLKELKHILYHEIGHHVFWRIMGSKERKRWVVGLFPKSRHISDYSKKNGAEDFAECYAFYMHSPALLREIKEKYEFINNLP